MAELPAESAAAALAAARAGWGSNRSEASTSSESVEEKHATVRGEAGSAHNEIAVNIM